MQGKRTANRRAAALRQALMLSISSMLVCAMMLVGMTYAWFTDSAVTAVNAIHTGTLNVDLMYSNTPIQQGNANAQRLYSNSKLFTRNRWEPNNVEVVYLAVVNNGSLPVRYSLTLNNVSTSTNSETTEATDPLQNFQYVIVPLTAGELIVQGTERNYFTTAISSQSENMPTPHLISDTAGGVQSKTLAASGAATAKPTEYYALILYYKSQAQSLTQDTNVRLGLRLLAIQDSTSATANDNDIDPDTQKPFKYTDVTDQPTTTIPETSNSAETSEN